MIATLVIGRGGSTGLPRKNVMNMVGRPLMAYPILAAQNSKEAYDVYLSTDDEEIKKVGASLGAKLIQRPDYLATKEALAEDAFVHGFEYICESLKETPEFIVLLFANGATVLPKYIDEAVDILRKNPDIDSVVTASCYNMWSPTRARKIDEHGMLVPFIDPSYFGDSITCDRGSQGDSWYADCSMFVVRPKCMRLREGVPPFRWIGKKVHPIQQWGGLDIDYKWQVPMVDFWLREHGFTETKLPYEVRNNV
ncbi:MAG: cytidylyltransferase domain-containing protein [Bdellovibrio sp.]